MAEYFNIETMSAWMVQYGSISLFILLALGIIVMPVPEETLLTITGILLYKGILNLPATLIAAYTGSMCGMTVSYIIGKNVGSVLLHKYGSWLGITELRLQQAHNWFQKYGKWSLTFGYFIPGIRHFTGISAGATELEFKYFALYAYSGALVWASLFLSVGYFFGDYWISLMQVVEESIFHIIVAVVIAVAIILAFFFGKKWLTTKLH